MMFSRDGWMAGVQRVATIAVAALLLVSCGGGEQVKRFVAGRVLAFGDEASVIESDGRKYSVNSAVDTTATSAIDCGPLPIWIQIVASAYSVPFPQCPGTATSTPSRILATPNARVADVAAQIDGFLRGDGFTGTDLVTLMAGANDMKDLYDRVQGGGYPIEQAIDDAGRIGTDLAGQVNRMAQLGAKVLISTIPDQSFTPDGRSDATKADALHRLTERFNARLRVGLINDGRMIGLVLFNESVDAITRSVSFNSTDPACNDATLADVRTCTTNTLRVLADGTTTANTASWLWADQRRLGPIGHATLGSLASNRAATNPF